MKTFGDYLERKPRDPKKPKKVTVFAEGKLNGSMVQYFWDELGIPDKLTIQEFNKRYKEM
jgi:hypothetical protein